MLTRVLLCAACLLTAGRARAADTVAGRYGELMLAVTGDRITGAFTSQRGRNGPTGLPSFSCAFLLQGRLVDGHAQISTWTPGTNDVVAGDLTVAPPRATLRLRDQQPGCDIAAGDMVSEDYEVTRDTVGLDWLAVRMVASKRAAPRDEARPVASVSLRVAGVGSPTTRTDLGLSGRVGILPLVGSAAATGSARSAG